MWGGEDVFITHLASTSFLQFLIIKYIFNSYNDSHLHGQRAYAVTFSCLSSFIYTSISMLRFLSCNIVYFSLIPFSCISLYHLLLSFYFSLSISYWRFPHHLVHSFYLSFLPSFSISFHNGKELI
jgi:hypothetical protein